MRGRIAWTIALRELLDTVRDRRTLLLMLGMPLVLYPGLILVTLQLGISHLDELDRMEQRVVLAGEGRDLLEDWLGDEDDEFTVIETGDYTGALLDGETDAVVIGPAELEPTGAGSGTTEIRILFDGAEVRSRTVAQRVERALEEIGDELLLTRLERVGLPESYVEPIKVAREDAAPPEKSTGFLIGSILPLALVMMITLGAFYPAVDLTAGEKERGTFETLLATPISKLEIVTGKFAAVLGIALIVGVLNLLSMSATLLVVFFQMPEDVRGAFPINVEFQVVSILVLLLAILPLALFVAGLMMAVAVFARSFKEGSNYATPVLFVILVLAVYGEAPGVKLEGILQYIPITNVVLLCREMLMGTVAAGPLIAVLLSTSIWAMLAVLLAAWIFQREEVVLASEGGSLTLRRSLFPPRDYPSAGLSAGLFAIVMLLIFYVGAPVQQWRLLEGLAITQWLVVLGPVLLLCWYLRIRFRSALLLDRPAPLALTGSFIAGVGTSLLAIQLAYWQSSFIRMPEGFAELMGDLLQIGDTPGQFALLLLIMAVSPAICEELLFRGAILQGLRQRMHPLGAILITGMLFGIFHLSFFRVLPTAVLGIFLAWIAWRSRSVFPAMATHLVHNGVSLCLAFGYLPVAWAGFLGLEQAEAEGLPIPALLVGVIFFLGGLSMILLSKHRSEAGRAG